jgi:hypothetical protein
MPAGAETRSGILVQHQQHARLHVQEILGNIVVVHPECFGTITVFIQDFKII